MIGRLIRAELTRLLHRRRVVVSFLLLMAICVGAPMMYMESARPLNDFEIAESYRSLAEVGSDCLDCKVEDFRRSVWGLPEVMQYGLVPFAMLLAVLVLLIAVVYSGSDFASGVIGTQLTFTPKRSALVLARTVVGAIYGGALAGLGTAVTVTVTMVWFIAIRGYADVGDGSPVMELLIWTAVYGAILGALGSLVVVLCNGTTAAAALLFAVMIGSSFSEVLGTVAAPGWVWHVLPTRQAEALVTGYSQVMDEKWEPAFTMVRSEAIGYHLVVLVLVAALTLFVFERRDIKS